MAATPAIYLDNNATTRPSDAVAAAMDEAIRRYWHNPSSLHRPGQEARRQVELARESIAALFHASDRELILTAGGTEADNLAVLGTLAASDRRVLVSTRLEHPAVRQAVEHAVRHGAEAVWLDIDADGRVDAGQCEELLRARRDEIALVSVMWANNETGVIQPVERIGALCREHGVPFHTDAVQWAGKMPVSFAEAPIDLLSFSGHKFHGPKGAGGLLVRRRARLEPRAIGGGQERARRGGTENVAGIVGLGVACAEARSWLATDDRARLEEARDTFERRILEAVSCASVNGLGAARTWNTASIAFEHLEAEAILIRLSERGVCASAGAACSSGSLEASPVLLASGIAEAKAHGTIRFSLSRETTAQDLDAAVAIVVEAIERVGAVR